jgi:D-alanyl-D-alanine carboxypeptidase/D-alanyl-D-alanine-endopeptidase (penicillin-binding protein 4)
MTLVPDTRAGVARVQWEPLAGVQQQPTVPLAPAGTDCGDWRSTLQGEWANPRAWALPAVASCGDKVWSIAPADPQQFAARAMEGMWRELGGKLTGACAKGVPAGLKPAFVAESPALGEVVRDINKYSNNVMTQQVFLTLGLEQSGVASLRPPTRPWPAGGQPLGAAEQPVVDNGAGLSREARISAHALGRMLQTAWQSPVMPEYLASLPIAGGRHAAPQQGPGIGPPQDRLAARHALAGYVDGASGKRYVLVAMVNHAAGAARPAMDALVDWVARQRRRYGGGAAREALAHTSPALQASHDATGWRRSRLHPKMSCWCACSQVFTM